MTGLNGQEILQRLTKLSACEKMKQVQPLSYALFPGYHCPLMGAMLTVNHIKGSVLMVLGPDECTYYTKMATSGTGQMAADGCVVVSCVMDHHDVTFGAQEALEEAFAELTEEYHPQAVYLVSTCVPEIIGDDVEAIAAQMTEQYGYPVMVVHAENFKTDDHLPGIAHTMEVSCTLMEKGEADLSVNVLGLRLGDFTKTECCRVLREAGVRIRMMLPGETSIEEIRHAPDAAVNIVVHPVGLALAEEMKERFGTPYILFERFTDPDHILASYRELFAALQLSLPAEVEKSYNEALLRTKETRDAVAGGTYFSGNTALCNYELHAFLCEKLGVTPTLLQISDLDEIHKPYRDTILRYADPYVSRAANIGALKYLYPVLKPAYNIGAGNPMEMRKTGTAMIMMMQAYNTLGFEVNEMVCTAVAGATEQYDQMAQAIQKMIDEQNEEKKS